MNFLAYATFSRSGISRYLAAGRLFAAADLGHFPRSFRHARAFSDCSAGFSFAGGSGRSRSSRRGRVPLNFCNERAARSTHVTPYQFSIRVSDILRRYVVEQYQLPVTRQTSVEFLEALAKASPFSEDERALLGDFLNRCDLIKFARYEATTADSELSARRGHTIRPREAA